MTAVPRSALHYWRDAAGHEVDFAVVAGRDRVAAVEAKVSPQALDAKSLRAFRAAYPQGPNLLCCPLVAESAARRYSRACPAFSTSGPGSRTVRTGHGARRTTSAATLPSSNCPTAPSPRVPMTISSAPCSPA